MTNNATKCIFLKVMFLLNFFDIFLRMEVICNQVIHKEMAKMNNQNEAREKLMKKLIHELPVLRARLGISQAELADKVGISRQTFNSIETGKREMTWTTFMALVAVFQNNEQTRQMLSYVNDWNEELEANFSV